MTLDTIEVDALTSSVQTALTERHQSPNAKVVIEAEQLNQFNDMSVGDAIRRLPGVTFPGVNRSREIKLRGLPGQYTQVLLDGRPLLDGDTGRSIEVDRIPAIVIERIEIIRTPTASMIGGGAAGTVNIITKRNFGKSGGGLALGGGNVENFKGIGEANGYQGGQAGPVRYFIGGGYQHRVLEESATTRNFTTALAPNGGNYQDQRREFDEYTALSRIEWSLPGSNTFTFSPTYLKTVEIRNQPQYNYNTAQTVLSPTPNSWEKRYRLRETYGTFTEFKHDFNSTSHMRAFFDYQRGREDTDRINVLTNALNSYVPIDLFRYAPGVASTVNLGGHQVETGAGMTRLARNEFNQGTASQNYKEKEDIYYAYVGDSFSFVPNDKLTVGVRAEHGRLNVVNNVGLTRESSATDVLPSLNYRHTLLQNLDLRLGVARTLRRPDLRELSPTIASGSGTAASPFVRGNPEATPESIWGVDAGADWFIYERLGIFSVNFFRRDFDNKIERTLRQEGTTFYSDLRNAGTGNLYGVELEGRVPLRIINLPNLTLWSNFTGMRSELTDPATGQTRRFAEQPDMITNIGLDYFIPAWKTTLGVNYNRVFAYSQDIQQRTGTGPITTQHTDFSALDKFDFSIRTEVAKNVTVSLAALNLLRPIDNRNVITYNAAGAVTGTPTKSEQRSHSTIYLRTNFTW